VSAPTVSANETVAQTAAAGRPPYSDRVPRRGFSLVEVIIALVILSAGVLGLAGATGQIIRQITLSDLITERSIAFQTIVERVQSMPYDSVGAGSDSVGIFAIRWNSVDNSGQSKTVTIVTVGPGLGALQTNNPQRADTFEFRVLRR
jgi:prepilin-type N-terminal cleavage/methylation domain-containing protein